MKRHSLIALCLATVMLLANISALADPAPSNTPVMINGVRTAFFDKSGVYLPVMEEAGCVYAPVLPLGESLSLAVEADASTLAVTINGVRAAFFDAAGAYLPPVVVDGVVYAPLQAFLEACGVHYTLQDGAYMITLGNSTPAAAPTSVPTAAPTAAPLYGFVPLNTLNFSDFFTVETSCHSPDPNYKLSSYTVTSQLICRATTSHMLDNVSLTVSHFGTVRIPSSGYATSTIQDTIRRYEYSSDKEYIWAQTGLATSALLNSYTIERVSGNLRMSWQEAQELNQYYYDKADAYLGLGAYDNAIKLFTSLASVDYADSADRIQQARDTRAAKEKAQQDALQKKREDQYSKAIAAMDEQDYTTAIPLLQELAKIPFKDSSDKLTEAQQAEKQQRYDAADAALAQGDSAAALELFAQLAEEGYSDAMMRKGMIHYAQAEQLLAEGKYQEASDAFKAASIYSDATKRILEPFYVQAEALLAAGEYEAASDAFAAAYTYKDATQRIHEPFFVKGEKLLAEGDYDGAVEAFRQAGSSRKALARINETRALQADALLASGDAYGAINAWGVAGMHDRFNDGFRYLARQSEAAGDYTKAIWYYELIGGTEANECIAALHYAQGQAAEAAGNTDDAIAAYAQAGEHPEAKVRYQELAYARATELTKEKDFVGAYRLFDTLAGYSDVDTLLKKNGNLKKAAQKVMTEKLHTVSNVGDYITFGTWEEHPLRWKVLAKEGDKILVICCSAVQSDQPFTNKTKGVTTWANTNWRKWLNGTFIKKAFSAKEQKALVSTNLTTNVRVYKQKPVNTKDRVFLLSHEEMWQYIGRTTRTRVGPDAPVAKDLPDELVLRTTNSNGGYDYAYLWRGILQSSGSKKRLTPAMWLNLAANGVDWEAKLPVWGIEPELRARMDKGRFDIALHQLEINKTWGKQDLFERECYYRMGVQALQEGSFGKAWSHFHQAQGYALADELKQLAFLRAGFAQELSIPGNVVLWGKYEQNNAADGLEPLKWIVLTVKDNRALLMTEKIIETRLYTNPPKDFTWETSPHRTWLNGTFLNDFFTEEEKAVIALTHLEHHTGYRQTGSPTDDKIFLPGMLEQNYWHPYAKAEETDLVHAQYVTKEKYSNLEWMLRDLSENRYGHMEIYTQNGEQTFLTDIIGIRPAMWLDLDMLK